MTRPLLIGIVVLGLVVSGAVTPAVGAATAASTNTAAQANATDGNFPPGLNASGVTDPLALADAHRAALENTSYTTTSTVVFRSPNGTLASRATSVTRVADGGASFSVVSTQSQANASRFLGVEQFRVGVWANESTAVVADTYRTGEPRFRQIARGNAPMGPGTEWELLYAAFGATDSEVVDRFERDGTTFYRVVSVGRPDRRSAYPRHAGFDWVAVVDSQGVVREFQQTHRTTYAGRPAVVTRTVRVSNLGNTTVERPDWYDEAVGNESDGG